MRALQGRSPAGTASSRCSSRPHALRHALLPVVPRHLASRQNQQCAAAAEEAAAGSNGAAGLPGAGVDFEELSDIIRMVNETDIIELELNSKKFNLSLRKKEALIMEQQKEQMQFAPAHNGYAAMPPPPAAPAPAIPAPAAAPPTPAPAPVTPSPQKIEGIEITSPMSGTFYTAPAPGEPPFCKEGDKVTKGQTVGIIEAMKLMNEIEAEISGTVVKVIADNGTPVAPGMALLLIKP